MDHISYVYALSVCHRRRRRLRLLLFGSLCMYMLGSEFLCRCRIIVRCMYSVERSNYMPCFAAHGAQGEHIHIIKRHTALELW